MVTPWLSCYAAGERFDIIVASPPYVISPETSFLYGDSGMPADAVSPELVSAMPDHLEEAASATYSSAGRCRTCATRSRGGARGPRVFPASVWILGYLTEDPLTQAAKWIGRSHWRDPSNTRRRST